MSDFITSQQCDEMTDYRPTESDWQEYGEWLDSQQCDDDLC